MSEDVPDLKLYADAECTQPILTIEWNNKVIMKLVDGTEKILPNCARGGDKAIAAVWVKNETPYDFGITSVSFPDNRVRIVFSSPWVYPNQPVMLTLVFDVPEKATAKDIIRANKLQIGGYYIYK